MGDLEERSGSVEDKVAELEKIVRQLNGEKKISGPTPYRKPISESKVIQNVAQLLEDKKQVPTVEPKKYQCNGLRRNWARKSAWNQKGSKQASRQVSIP